MGPGTLSPRPVFFLNHVALSLGLIVLALLPAARKPPGRVGTWIALTGMVLLAACELWAITLADTPAPSPTGAIETAYGVATILLGVGLTLAGIGVARTRRWRGW